MTIASGTELGTYEILSLIGAGGMGEVYKARDRKLKREVAVKVLPGEFSRDPDRVFRFQREAEALAALNHSNIAGIYDVQESNGIRFLVLELVDGETLAERVKRGPLPLETVLSIGKQISDALDAAHDKGIIHRDLKPANIKITPDGKVKLLDFGLARLFEGEAEDADPSNSPTLLSRTGGQVILGTASYMSPEQARGKKVGKQADIWAFGVVLYEMITGERLFKGEDTSEILAAVIKEEPKLDRIPVTVRRLLLKCLEKDPKRRLRDIADAWALVDNVPVAAPVPQRAWLAWIVAALCFVVLLAAAPFAFVHFREKPLMAELVRFQIPMPEKVTLGNGGFNLSPDGRQLVFSPISSDGSSRLWVRSLDSLEARPLPGTEGAGNFPAFWSPDSRFIGFAVAGKYMKVPISGGPAQTLGELPGTLGASAWSRDGTVLLTANPGGLWRVPESGGTPTAVTIADPARQELYHGKPSFLPDGRHFLYYRVSGNPEFAGTYVGSLDLKPEQQDLKRLLPGQVGSQYVPSSDPAMGYVIFLREATLMAQPFDTRRLELTGEAVPIAEQVGNNGIITGFFSASDNGVLAYRVGGGGERHFIWLDPQGKQLGIAGDPSSYSEVALSADATRLASARTGSPRDIWLFEFARGVSTRFTFSPLVERYPVWSPDGTRIAFASNQSGRYDLYQKIANGAGEDELLLKSDQDKLPSSWSHDGHFLLYMSNDPKTRQDLWALPLDGDRKPVPVLRTEFNEGLGSFSPNTRWVAYLSNESGRYEVYVRPFSPSSAAGNSLPAGKWQVSKGAAAIRPSWRADGKELYYQAANRKMMAVEVDTSTTFKAAVPKELFDAPPNAVGQDMTTDGKRFLFVTPVLGNVDAPITLVLNWVSALPRK